MVHRTIQVKKHIYTTDIDKKYWRVTDSFFTEYGAQIGGEIQKKKLKD